VTCGRSSTNTSWLMAMTVSVIAVHATQIGNADTEPNGARRMSNGTFVGADGRAHNVRSVMLDELDDACNSATIVQLNGGAWLTYKKHLLPSHPDFPLAVAALQALIRPSLDPRAGRVLAMREAMSEQWAYVSGVTWTWQS
jgi:hypothetical protein